MMRDPRRIRAVWMNCGPLFDGLALRTVHRAREVAHLSGRVEGLRAEVAQVRQDLPVPGLRRAGATPRSQIRRSAWWRWIVDSTSPLSSCAS